MTSYTGEIGLSAKACLHRDKLSFSGGSERVYGIMQNDNETKHQKTSKKVHDSCGKSSDVAARGKVFQMPATAVLFRTN